MYMEPFMAWIHWDPPRHIFKIPYLNHPITFYGLFFVTGFIISYFILAWMFKQKLNQTTLIREKDIDSWPSLVDRFQTISTSPSHFLYPYFTKLNIKCQNELVKLQCHQEPSPKLKGILIHLLNEASTQLGKTKLQELLSPALITSSQWGYLLTDRLTWFIVLGTLIGARLGDVFFYDWPYFKEHPLDIIMVWKGGLASHGGVVGVLLAMYLYYRRILKSFPEISYVNFLDMIAVPSALAACFIRIGNFFNQEILGPPTMMPWGIVFGDPMDYYTPLPRHPTQLYEAAAYLVIFALLCFLWKKGMALIKPGLISGCCLILIFGARFLLEFIKVPQSQVIDESFLMMGQYLSLPFVLLGIALLLFGKKPQSAY
jgi:phosphatidylglycerol---prolipoprotein diacylglyceryl transferase